MVKAQIHAGGRGKGGGVKLARSIDEVRQIAGETLGVQLISHQTRPAGQKVRRLLIEAGADIQKEYCVAALTDRASLAEINPLNLEGGGGIKALDAKFNFDASALFRHPEIVACLDLDEEDPAEVEASKFDLAYISLDGNIGCLVNGAGLADRKSVV